MKEDGSNPCRVDFPGYKPNATRTNEQWTLVERRKLQDFAKLLKKIKQINEDRENNKA